MGAAARVLGLTPAMAAALERIPGARAVTHPLVALPAWLVTYYAWHLPWAYDAALRHQWTILHAEHACYFAAGVLVWWPVCTAGSASGTKALYLFGAFVLASPLGCCSRSCRTPSTTSTSTFHGCGACRRSRTSRSPA